MEQIISKLWLGGDADVPESKRRGYARLAACKDGIDGHREMLGYTTLGAPKDADYYFAKRGDWMALNLIDASDPEMIPDAVIDAGLKFVNQIMTADKKILVHCNAGMSRGPSMVLMYLRAIGELPQGFNRAEHVFRTLYPKYDPSVGLRSHARERWNRLPDFFKK